MDATIYESLLPGWPVGELGVAITARGVLLRAGLSPRRRKMAIRWALTELSLRESTGQLEPCSAPLQSGAANVKPSCCRDLNREDNAELVKEREHIG